MFYLSVLYKDDTIFQTHIVDFFFFYYEHRVRVITLDDQIIYFDLSDIEKFSIDFIYQEDSNK